MEAVNLERLKSKRDWRIILPVFLVSIIACIDRVNVAYAKLTRRKSSAWAPGFSLWAI